MLNAEKDCTVSTPADHNNESFVKWFKQRRVMLGVTQKQLASDISLNTGQHLIQSTISKMERNALDVATFTTLKPLLLEWSKCHNNERATYSNSLKLYQNRKTRTRFSTHARLVLLQNFADNPRPKMEEIYNISSKLQLEPNIVKTWFSNRRQMVKKRPSSGRHMNPQ